MCGTYDMYISMYAHDMLAYADFFSLCTSFVDTGERRALTENVRLGRSQVELSYASSPLTMTSWMISVMLHVNASTFNVQLFNLGNGQQTSARFAAMFAIPK